MAETIGKVTNIKLATVDPDFPNAIDVGAVYLKETSTGTTWLFYLWVSHAADPAVNRVLQSQRLALVREAAFHHLTVHLFHDDVSNSVFEITVDTP